MGKIMYMLPMALVILCMFLLGLMLAIFGVLVSNSYNAWSGNKAQARAEIVRLVAKSAGVLAQRKAQTTHIDRYQNAIADRWHQERVYFIQRTLHSSPAWDKAQYRAQELFDLIDEHVERVVVSEKFKPDMHPGEYERLCGSILENDGWTVQVTQLSGDQGVDVYATKDAASLVIQCKRYSKPVGNKAVQEVVAAQGYMQAKHAAVVSNHTYTKQAITLANANNVALLHHDDLADYAHSISSKNWPGVAPFALTTMPPPATP